jgi:lipopolysaccharide export system protein LptA
MLRKLIYIVLAGVICQTGFALDSDMEQPATLDADDFEMDFNTGVRIYRGNVEFRQGSIRLNCDELTTYLNQNDELDKAICIGSPGRFKQRPEGQQDDVVGTAGKITMDQINNLITLKSGAKVVQGGSTITGKTIAYDMSTEKVKVKGGASQGTKKTTKSTSSGETAAEASGSESTDVELDSSENSRPSLVIQPRKKKTATE